MREEGEPWASSSYVACALQSGQNPFTHFSALPPPHPSHHDDDQDQDDHHQDDQGQDGHDPDIKHDQDGHCNVSAPGQLLQLVKSEPELGRRVSKPVHIPAHQHHHQDQYGDDDEDGDDSDDDDI